MPSPAPSKAPPSNVAELLVLHEKRMPSCYPDSLGYMTIGVGHLIDARKGGALPDVFIDALLQYDIQEKVTQLHAALPWVEGLDEVRHAVLVDMTFNMGITGLLGFVHFLASMKAGDYITASQQMLQSRWATEVGTRSTRLSHMVSTGLWQY